MPKRYWLFKSEPTSYSWDHLVKDGVAEWDGVRNFQARNMLRDDIKEGDDVLFYHSSTVPTAVIGIAAVIKSGHPDKTALDMQSAHPDPRSTPENPIWFVVDIKAQRKFPGLVTLEEMRKDPRLAKMALLRRGMRLSIQPVTPEEFAAICQMGGVK